MTVPTPAPCAIRTLAAPARGLDRVAEDPELVRSAFAKFPSGVAALQICLQLASRSRDRFAGEPTS